MSDPKTPSPKDKKNPVAKAASAAAKVLIPHYDKDAKEKADRQDIHGAEFARARAKAQAKIQRKFDTRTQYFTGTSTRAFQRTPTIKTEEKSSQPATTLDQAFSLISGKNKEGKDIKQDIAAGYEIILDLFKSAKLPEKAEIVASLTKFLTGTTTTAVFKNAGPFTNLIEQIITHSYDPAQPSESEDKNVHQIIKGCYTIVVKLFAEYDTETKQEIQKWMDTLLSDPNFGFTKLDSINSELAAKVCREVAGWQPPAASTEPSEENAASTSTSTTKQASSLPIMTAEELAELDPLMAPQQTGTPPPT